MLVCDIMSRDVRTVAPDASLQWAAQTMLGAGIGALPVCDGDRLMGIITDRDIAIRAVAAALPANAPVSQAMTRDALFAYEDEEVEAALQRMKTLQVRRLVVLDRTRRLVGIVSLGDIAVEPDAARCEQVGTALAGISNPVTPTPELNDLT
jgi:CBS domain-containing protein